jgi:hypothetical protein
MSVDMRYTLQQFNMFGFNGFEYSIPQQTIDIINNLTTEVGSTAHVKNSLFQKKYSKNGFNGDSLAPTSNSEVKYNKRRKGNKAMEMSTEEWESLRSFQPTKIENKTGIDSDIDQIRLHLNKLTDKTFLEMREKLKSIINKIVSSENFNEETSNRISTTIYDISSSNKFYSKIYADLYAELLINYEWLRPLFDNKITTYMDNFKDIQYFDPDKNYDKFCEMNKQNELRRAHSQFIVNLALNGSVSKIIAMQYLKKLIELVVDMINQDDKKNEVDELTENIAILYNKDMIDDIEDDDNYEVDQFLINGKTINETIILLAKSKTKDYKSLSNKATFKYMDLIEI